MYHLLKKLFPQKLELVIKKIWVFNQIKIKNKNGIFSVQQAIAQPQLLRYWNGIGTAALMEHLQQIYQKENHGTIGLLLPGSSIQISPQTEKLQVNKYRKITKWTNKQNPSGFWVVWGFWGVFWGFFAWGCGIFVVVFNIFIKVLPFNFTLFWEQSNFLSGPK